MLAYKANGMVDVDVEGRVSVQGDVFLRVVAADYCNVVIMQFIERARPWSSNRMESMLYSDLRTIESSRGVLLPLPSGVIKRMLRVGVCQFVLGTCYSPTRALVVLVCACAIYWSRLDVIGWFPYHFTTGDLYAVPPRRTNQA